MLLKVLIVDDEPIARDILTEYVAKVPDIELAGTCANAVEVFAFLNKNHVDVVLLDINMPEITGVELLQTLRNPPMVIFTTAYSEYAVESYEHNAIDYLLKPIAFNRFAQAINKAVTANVVDNTVPQKAQAEDSFFVKSDGKLIKVLLNELYYIEALKDYVKLWLNNNTLIVHSTMKNMEEQLKRYDSFLRIHKSFLINLKHVSEVEGNMIKLGEYTTLIGNTYKDAVMDELAKHRLL